MLRLLPAHLPRSVKVQVHCFSRDTSVMEGYLRVLPQTILSISGLALLHGTPSLQWAIQAMDLTKLVLEMNAPYLAPPGAPFHCNHP